ncbi:MAG TPA: arginine repressor [Firmicutes bacterium]|nr:arginine repressor [Bacillota bacterium]
MSLNRKIIRQRELLKIVRSQAVRTQVELADFLNKRGFAVSQPTLSKDIAELGLVKVPLPDGGYRYQATRKGGPDPQGRRLQISFREFLVKTEPAGQLIVLKSIAGHAAGLAWALDNADWPEVVGTIAGEDTVLIITRSPNDAQIVMSHIEQVLTP